MSKGNLFLGHARGSVGDVTFYRRNGKQITRAKAQQVTNPRSEAQSVQRMIFGTVTAAYSRMKTICDHSFEGVKYGANSQAKFMKENLKRLRAFYPIDLQITSGGLANYDLADIMAYSDKGNPQDSGTGLIIARGSLPQVPIMKDANNSGKLDAFGSLMTADTIENVLNALGAQIGDQITVCALIAQQDSDAIFVKSRYVVDVEADAQELAVPWRQDGVSAAYDQNKTQVNPLIELSVIQVQSNEFKVVPKVGDSYIPIAVGVILSRKSESGKWLRSDTILYNAQDEHPTQSAEVALLSWLAGTTVVETSDEKYLNNADI